MTDFQTKNQQDVAPTGSDSSSNHQIGTVIWLTGLSGSGKSTVSSALNAELIDQGVQSYILDGDIIRKGLCSDLGFSPEDRSENIRRIGEVANILSHAGVTVVAAFISPYRSDRNRVRSILENDTFVEVFVDCPIEECEKRDPKGLYVKARAGEIPEFTGVSAPYEPPLNPEVHLRTSETSIQICTEQILTYLKNNHLLNTK